MKPSNITELLLKRFGVDDALIGDLTEEYGRRSAVWYYRQVLVAIIGSVLRAIREHRLLAARAVVTGLVVQALLSSGQWIIWGHLQGRLAAWAATLGLHSYSIVPALSWAYVGVVPWGETNS
jgi:hypothetical protein